MSISNEDVEILIKSAGVEIVSAPLPFDQHAIAVGNYFEALDMLPESGFKWIQTKEISGDRLVQETSLGTFDITPQIGKLLVPQDGGGKVTEIKFFDAADETASLVSATVRFTERRLAYVKKQREALHRPSSER